MNTYTQPAYSTAFDSCTRGYLVTREEGDGGGKQKHGDQRCWCVLDGSSLICYRDEEVDTAWGIFLLSSSSFDLL